MAIEARVVGEHGRFDAQLAIGVFGLRELCLGLGVCLEGLHRGGGKRHARTAQHEHQGASGDNQLADVPKARADPLACRSIKTSAFDYVEG